MDISAKLKMKAENAFDIVHQNRTERSSRGKKQRLNISTIPNKKGPDTTRRAARLIIALARVAEFGVSRETVLAVAKETGLHITPYDASASMSRFRHRCDGPDLFRWSSTRKRSKLCIKGLSGASIPENEIVALYERTERITRKPTIRRKKQRIIFADVDDSSTPG